ncbi:MAG: RnfABCDGE type electron transport complex subunit G [Eubacteriales bacterium]
MTKNEKSSAIDIGYILRIALPLFIITASCALLLAVVNGLTAQRIADNAARAKSEAIAAIFTGCDEETPTLDAAFESPVNAVYEVYSGGALEGWCVSVSPKGFGGGIDMMVGISLSHEVVGVKIVDHSETPGLGARTDDAEYLAQYAGLTGKPTLGGEVDAIAGATISSRAVLAGVNAALALDFASGNGAESIPSDITGGDGQ